VDYDTEHDKAEPLKNNWATGTSSGYRQTAARLARTHASAAATAVDIGPCRPSIVELLGWVPSRTVVDLGSLAGIADVRQREEELLRRVPEHKFGLVICLQALDQVPRPGTFLRKLLTVGEIVVVAVTYKGPADPERDHQPLEEVKLQRWARRRWLESEVVADERGPRLVAVFRGGEDGVAGVACDFGTSDNERAWLDDLAASIEAVRLPRRRPPFGATMPARLFQDDPLRRDVTGTVGVYVVRALWNALGFDEHRKFRWRLEHKLVQASVFNRYLGGEFPASWGVRALLRRGLGDQLHDALLAGKVFAKEALGHLSGDYGEAEATYDVLCWLLGRREVPPAGTAVEEEWLVQERIPIEREYRVHSLEDLVLPEMTFDRYGPCPVPEGRAEVNAYVASILARLPDALVEERSTPGTLPSSRTAASASSRQTSRASTRSSSGGFR
jgi:hypothetical protein